MKRLALYIGLTAALVASCSTQEKDFQTHLQDDVVFYASFEQPVDEGTRVYANEGLLLRWTADDRISIFNKNTYNQQYRFAGETGDNAGGFDKVAGSEFATGNAISHVVSVYPYQSTTKISESESLTLTLPAEQHYAENSFGLGANTMVSVTADNFLQYKTVGGYLRLRLYGEGVSVSSITLKGNNDEKLAGKATVTMPLDGTPTVTLAEDAMDQISLVCDTPVTLGATAEESKDFWLVVPPVTFSKGFTVTVSGKGGVFEKSTEKAVTIERNKLSKMAPIEVELTPTQPRNVIYYTSSDGNVITPNNPDVFGASILSNEYVEGLGVITFDGDVTSIGDSAFSGCTSLTSITIPDSVTSIGESAFIGCTSLTSITIPEGVTSIGRNAFSGCRNLTSITIPEGVTSIGAVAFGGCSSLMSFSGKYSSPDGHFLIDSGSIIAVAFAAFQDGIVNIPDDVTGIGDYAFAGGYNLTSITIPDSVTSIGESAFIGCTSLTSITIPNSVTSIGNSAFSGCTSLTRITIPERVTSIGNFAFFGCTSLTSITIPNSVTSIGNSAFSNCTSLTSITIPEGVTSIGNSAFSNCTSLTSITIPDSVTSIGSFAFSGCTSLTSFTIPDSVTSIGSSAFYGCTSLTSITIPNSVTSIGSSVFYGCTSLAGITIPESVTSIGYSAFGNCESLTSISIPGSVETIGSAAFLCCYRLTELTISKGVKIIGTYAFQECTSLSSVTIPESVTSIGAGPFCLCSSLMSFKGKFASSDGRFLMNSGLLIQAASGAMAGHLDIPDSVTRIGDDAFNRCTGLTSVTIPKSVTRLGKWAFYECTDLTSITVLPDFPPVGQSLMLDSTNNCPIYVPAGSIDAYKSAQYWNEYADRIQAIPSAPVPEAVDLGLPSGLKWASFNLGASSPEEYGDYFAWGETEPYYSNLDPLTWKDGKSGGYSWSSYKWCIGDYKNLTKYCYDSYYGFNGFTDTKTVLDLEDDAASVILGSGWRMPTDAEWTELRNNCTWTWTTQNGIAGRRVTARNGNSIFLPAAGYRSGTNLYDAGYDGEYWSSTLYTDAPLSEETPPYAWTVVFVSGNVVRLNGSRQLGESIRPVSE